MYLKTALEIIVAMLAVFGFYSIVRLIVQKIFVQRNFLLAIEILDPDDVSNAEMYLREVFSHYMTIGAERVALIVPENLMDDDEILRVIDAYGVECYVINE